MSTTTREELEARARSLCEQGDYAGAAGAAIRGYGPEIFGLLASLHPNEDEAADVFSTFSEALWRGLPDFDWECSLRTWAYVIARNASRRCREQARRHAARHIPLSQDSAVTQAAQEVRTATLSFLRTAKRDRLAALRDALPEDDRMLLVLRIDRGLTWDDLARVLGAADAPLKRESARLRKRFQLVKEKLMALAKREGLVKAKET
jgi:RNA polymerase sigma-70 factor, ECF subfamily